MLKFVEFYDTMETKKETLLDLPYLVSATPRTTKREKVWLFLLLRNRNFLFSEKKNTIFVIDNWVALIMISILLTYLRHGFCKNSTRMFVWVKVVVFLFNVVIKKVFP